ALCRYQSVWNIDLKLRPTFLGGIMKNTGNKGPMLLPAKGQYMFKDLERNQKYFDVPMNVPSDPFEMIMKKGSIRSMRFLTWIDMNKPEYLEEVSRQLWMRNWSRDEDITQNESLEAAAKKAGFLDGDLNTALASFETPEVKKRLIDVTDEALAYGAFGAPWIVAHTADGSESFFGSDRFPILAMTLGEEWLGPNPLSSKL
ncbi:hypothetical protein QYM36_013491, partial [Artemia franciscana]